MKEIEKIMNIIEESFLSESFDPKKFEFYSTRKEKNKHAIGILNYNNQKYFYKIVKTKDYNDEDPIQKSIQPHFRLVKKLGHRQIGEETLNVYEYLNAHKENAFNFLRDKNVEASIKQRKLECFFKNKMELIEKTATVCPMTGEEKADVWFWGRLKKGGRFEQYYGVNGEKLLADIKNVSEKNYDLFKAYLVNLPKILLKKRNTVNCYCHGDFHDFNFSLDGLFWDTDTFGMNPALNDFSVYYWHFYAREDYLIYKYSPWLVPYLYDSLSESQRDEIRLMKKECISLWCNKLQTIFEENGLADQMVEEFTFKLLCRVFLITNVLEYDVEDRRKLYNYFSFVLKNKDKKLNEIIFANPELFGYAKKN